MPLRKPSPVRVWRQNVALPTYQVSAPDKNPMFIEKRVYQGSSGKVYPLPFTDRVAETPTPVAWDAVHLENEFLQIMVLPQIGGRIHVGRDKTNGYDFFYRQNVIKPALVGLAGPWISGGVEFNWPQHHRPSTYMPTDVHIEEHEDGSKTVWMSEHEPMNRMKGMHGVCLHPDKATIELKVRVFNRTPLTQTFLWWANVATRVHGGYQSFFPPDVHFVADHAKRAMSEYPLAQGHYYGVDYAQRAQNGAPEAEAPANEPAQFAVSERVAPNDLSFYANIPVPTSYMAMGSREDFFGGYDFQEEAGVVHVANHHIAPGKKQWTWGNHEFGYAWDRNLTDADENGENAPYIELMAGVYTDNQPDFSFLAPGETRTWSQFWYPIQKIGPAQAANGHAALSLTFENGVARVGVSPAGVFENAQVRLEARGEVVWEGSFDLKPGASLVENVLLANNFEVTDLEITDLKLSVFAATGDELIAYAPQNLEKGEVPPPATEPPLPAEIESTDELYLTGLHLEQFRHATRSPEPYWREALRRDSGDARCNNALGLWHLRRGEFEVAKNHFERATLRLTRLNPNPADGEPFYNLGLALRFLEQTEDAYAADAYAAFYKATWNFAWQAPAFLALAELDCRKGDWKSALDHLERALRVNAENLQARDLKVMTLRELGRVDQAEALLRETLQLDPLDWWARHLRGDALTCDTQTRLDLALDLSRAGFYREASLLLDHATPEAQSGTAPLVAYYQGFLAQKLGDSGGAQLHFERASQAAPDYCFPARLDEILVLQAAIAANPGDARAPYYLGNLFYDRQRYEAAIELWERAASLDAEFSIVWRNLGIAYFNVRGDAAQALAAYDQAVRANPDDARLLFERDQLWKRAGVLAPQRLESLEKRLDLVQGRDDLSVELAALFNQTGAPEKALQIIENRQFQPWEGGEGLALEQHVRTHLMLGQRALRAGDFSEAKRLFEAALAAPRNLGEAKHPLANQSDIYFWLGEASAGGGQNDAARRFWHQAAAFKGDFQEMSVRLFSEMTFYSALSLQRLGRNPEARKLSEALLSFADDLGQTPAKIDYFATSLPTMLLFHEDLQERQNTTALLLRAQALLGLNRRDEARSALRQVLSRDPNHALARDFLELWA